MEWILSGVEGIGAVCYVGVVFVVLFYGFVSTFGWKIGGDKIGEMVDEAYSDCRWFVPLVFVSGCVVGWQKAMFLGAWSVVVWMVKVVRVFSA